MAHHVDNVSAGTQVVSLVEVRGTKNSLVHPRGAVGVVTRRPTGGQKQFLVRFPDGFGFSLQRGEMALKANPNVGRCEGRGPSVASRLLGNSQSVIRNSSPSCAPVAAWRKELHRDFERALAETKPPERPEYETANRFLIKARRHIAGLRT